MFSLINDIIALVLNNNLLSLNDVITLTEVSKDLKQIIKEEEIYFWRRTFEEIMNCGTSYVSNSGDYLIETDEFLQSTNNMNTSRRHVLHKVDIVRNRLPNCLSTDVDPSIIKQYGYHHLTKCLLSKKCDVCGRIGNFANPIVFKRYCGQNCADHDKELISACRALEAGKMPVPLIKDGDLPIKNIESSTTPTNDSSTIPDMSDNEISDSSQHSNITGKGPMMINKTLRPSIYQRCYPVGVRKMGNERHLSNLAGFTHAYSCSSEGCNMSGNLGDIMRHRRLQHDIVYANQKSYDFEVVHPEAEIQRVLKSSFSDKLLKHKNVLSQIVSDSIFKQAMGVSTKKAGGNIIICFNWIISFYNGCALAIDLRSTVDNTDDNRESYDLDISFQKSDNSIPVHLVCLQSDNQTEASSDQDFINKNGLSFLQACLSLNSGSEVIELLAALTAYALPSYALESFSQKLIHKKDGSLKEIFRRIYHYSPSNVTPVDTGTQRSSIISLVNQMCSNSMLKMQKQISMYNVRRLVRRRA